MTSKDNLYFIVTTKPEHPQHIGVGRLCYVSKSKHRFGTEITAPHSPTKLPVFFLGSRTGLSYEVEVSMLEVLTEEVAELLQAVEDDAERLNWFRQKDALLAALDLTEGTAVTVDEAGEKLRGVIRYVGKLIDPKPPMPLSGRFFGIELQVEVNVWR